MIGVSCAKERLPESNPDKLTIVIDAGHGGKDDGAILENGVVEKDLNLSIVKSLQERNNRKQNFNLILTRSDDNYLTLRERIDLASDCQADLFISFHVNLNEDIAKSGIQCFIARDSEYSEDSKNIGEMALTELNDIDGIKTDETCIEANFYVLRNSSCPAILLEFGNLSNPEDLSFITDRNNQKLISDQFFDALVAIDKLYN